MKIFKKLYFCLYTILLCILIINLSTSLSCADAVGPSIIIDKPIYNFGQTEKGTIITHNFPIRNKGGEPLLIKRVKGG